jgi:gliding motility-associated-like protein
MSNSDGQFNNLPNGEYLILISDTNDCMLDLSATIMQETGGSEFDLGADQILCQGDTLRISAPENLVEYRWYKDNVPLNASGNSLNIREAGIYRLEARNNEGCVFTDQINIQVSELGGAASGDTEIERGDSTQLNSSGGENYRWSPMQGLSCTDCPNPKAAPETTTTYRVNYINADGCLVSDSVVIRVTIPEDELRFEPVTFLSPNGDGENDELFFPGLDTYQSNDINIYSRWGQLIYSKIDYQISGELWDGTLRGTLVPPGVYYYQLRVNEQNITVKRHLTIAY